MSGGITIECTKMVILIYESIVNKIVTVSSTETAEMVKLLENTFRAINIGLANEIAIMCEKLGINVWEVIDAASTKPFGFTPYYPGPVLGGHCIPIDPFYLTWKAKEFGMLRGKGPKMTVSGLFDYQLFYRPRIFSKMSTPC